MSGRTSSVIMCRSAENDIYLQRIYGIHFVCTKGQSTKFHVPFVEVKECSLILLYVLAVVFLRYMLKS